MQDAYAYPSLSLILVRVEVECPSQRSLLSLTRPNICRDDCNFRLFRGWNFHHHGCPLVRSFSGGISDLVLPLKGSGRGLLLVAVLRGVINNSEAAFSSDSKIRGLAAIAANFQTPNNTSHRLTCYNIPLQFNVESCMNLEWESPKLFYFFSYI